MRQCQHADFDPDVDSIIQSLISLFSKEISVNINLPIRDLGTGGCVPAVQRWWWGTGWVWWGPGCVPAEGSGASPLKCGLLSSTPRGIRRDARRRLPTGFRPGWCQTFPVSRKRNRLCVCEEMKKTLDVNEFFLIIYMNIEKLTWRLMMDYLKSYTTNPLWMSVLRQTSHQLPQ